MKTWTNIEIYFGMLTFALVIISLVLWSMWLRSDQKRLLIVDEIRSGETTSRRAKRILFPLFLIYILDLISSGVRCGLTGFFGFESVTTEKAGYSVVNHSHTYYLTPGEFWLGRIQAFILIVSFVAWFLTRAYFSHTGDLKRDKPAA